MRWPLVLRSTYDALQTENYTLRDALREANKEIRKHRMFVGGIRSGQIDIVNQFKNITQEKVK